MISHIVYTVLLLSIGAALGIWLHSRHVIVRLLLYIDRLKKIK